MVKVDLGKLDTEKVNENTKNIDKLSTLDMIKLINEEDHRVAEAVKEDVENIAKAVDLIYGRLIRGETYICRSRKLRKAWCFRCL